MKLIGFKLTGNTTFSLENELVVDPNKTFEIQFSPADIPIGILTHLGHEEKKVIVELPEEIKQGSFEKASTFLLEKNTHLIVKEYGFEKLGNRKLQLELCYDLKEPTVNVSLFIQGKWDSFDYKIELNPLDLSVSTGEIRNSKKSTKANIISKDLMNVKKCDLIKVLPKLKPNNFNISVEDDCIKIDLSAPLKQFIDSLGKPSKYQKPSKSMWSIFSKICKN